MARKSFEMKRMLASSVVLCGPAMVTDAIADTPSAITAPAADSSQGTGAQLEEIVVTATKRTENLQNVAESVSVISGAALQEQSRAQLSDYLAYTPGVSVSTTGSPGQSSITIRGISPLASNSKVATYIDETPLGSSGIWAQSGGLTLDLLPFDLDRLEVLRGPQGTLYGASSMGGLLKYVLTTPDTTAFSGAFAVDGSGIQGAGKPGETVMAHVNLPVLQDTLATSLSGFYKYTPGFIDDAYTGARDTNDLRQYGGRVGLFWKPADNLTVKLNGLWQTTESADDALESFANPTVAPTVATQPSLVSGGTGFGPLTANKAFAQPFSDRIKFYSGTVDWDLGFADLVSATSWSRLSSEQTLDETLAFGEFPTELGLPSGLSNAVLQFDLRKLTQELRLTSPQSDVVSWQIGGFYTDERQSNVQVVNAFDATYQPIDAFAPHLLYASMPTTYREYAMFGDVTWKIASAFDVTGGVRYSKNKQDFDTTQSGILLGQAQSPPVTLPPVPSSEDNTTWMANARYHFSSDVMTYFRAATGYAPGGANTPYPGVPQATVGAERLTSYEVGLKSEFFERRALLDVAVFHIDWKDIQLNALLNGISYSTNGGGARSDGIELSSSYSPVQGLTFGLNTAYTDARLTSLNPDVSTPFILGAQLQNVPKWTVSGTADYGWKLASNWTAHVGGGVRWTGEETGAEQAAGLPYFALPGNTVVDANGSIASGPWTFRIFANNLTNSRAYSFGLLDQSAVTGSIRQIDYSLIQPRTVGAGIVVRF
jgi:iron complex outermembrane recepter protein